MWGSVLGLAFLCALNPGHLLLILLVLSRPRPMHNLLAYGVGSLTGAIPGLVVPLAVLNFTPIFRSLKQDMTTPATSSTVQHIQIGFGVFLLSISALMTVRLLTSMRQQAQLSTPGGNTSTLVLDSNFPPTISRLLRRARDAGTENGSRIRRLLGRVPNAWENGSLWLSWLIGAVLGGPQPDSVVLLIAILVASGAATGTQVGAAILFLVGMLAVVEVVLVSHLATPAKTQAILRRLHDWVSTHRRQVLAAIFALVGVSLLANGMGMGGV